VDGVPYFQPAGRWGLFVEPRAVWAAVKAGWPVTLAGLLIGAALGFGAGVVVGPSYSTSMQFFVSTSNSDSTSDTFQGSQFAQERVASYAGALTGKELAARVVQRLKLDVAPEELAGEISASSVTGTVLLDVTVTDPSRTRADAIADALTIEFPEFVAALEDPHGDAESPVSITPTDRPGPAVAPSPSPAVRNALFGVSWASSRARRSAWCGCCSTAP